MALIPMITRAFIKDDQSDLTTNLNQTFQVLLFITLPACIGLSVLAEPVYRLFYGTEDILMGAEVLKLYAPVAILFSLYPVTASILQGLNEQRFTILSLLVGILIKLSLNMPFIERWETNGAILATTLGYTVSILINLGVIKAYANYSFKIVIRRSILIVGFSIMMYIVTTTVYRLLELFLSTESVFASLLMVVIVAVLGILVYVYLAFRSKLIYRLFGDQARRLKQKLKLPF